MRALALLLALCASLAAHAQQRPLGFPDRPVRVVYAAPPGGQGDLVTRFLAERMTPRLGQPLLVDNRPGGSGVVALEYVLRQPADGHHIAYGAAAWVLSNPALQPSMPFDISRDFRAVVRFGIAPQCLFVRSTLPVRTAREFFDLAKTQPGKLTYASFGIGSTSHLQMEMLKHLTGTDILHVPFRGSAQGIQEVATGRVDAFLIDFAPSRPFMETGQVRCLAMTGSQRYPEFPEVPTLSEQGLPLELIGWHGFFVPVATPDAVVNYLAEEVMRITRSEEGRAGLQRLGLLAVAEGPAEAQRIHTHDLARWRDAVRISGARPE